MCQTSHSSYSLLSREGPAKATASEALLYPHFCCTIITLAHQLPKTTLHYQQHRHPGTHSYALRIRRLSNLLHLRHSIRRSPNLPSKKLPHMRCKPPTQSNDANPMTSTTNNHTKDPRQYVPATGQSWTSLADSSPKQENEFSTDQHDSHIHYITTKPIVPADLPAGLSDATTTRKQLGIGERAILLQTPSGNVLWDLIAFIDEPTLEFIKGKGGLKAIVISHPHFYTTHLEWARVFGCPVYVCKADEEWLNRADKNGVRKFVKGTEEIVPGVTAIQAGGHFDGSMFLHWEKKLFIADTMMSVPVRPPATPLPSLACPSSPPPNARHSPASTTKTASRAPPAFPLCGRIPI